jgi:antirestriction protein ArdC
MAKNIDITEIVVKPILEALDRGDTVPWHKPWNPAYGLPRSLSTGKAYRGLNVFVLGFTAIAKGYESPWWGTYKQISERGGQVRKDEKSTIVSYWKPMIKEDESGNTKSWFMLKYFRVFNADQCDNVKVPAIKGNDNSPIELCEQICAGYDGPEVFHGDSRAFYNILSDQIHLPDMAAFESAESYYSTRFHEMTHSTGHASRLAREGIVEHDFFGSPVYSEEELIAEMGAAMLAGHAGIHQTTIQSSAAYIASWRKKLGDDPGIVLRAASKAQRAADMILGVSYSQESSEDDTATQAA